jgi:hypothetical protein
MLKKMMSMFVVMFSTVMIVNAQEVTDELEKAVNDPQVATEQQKNAEINEIDTKEQAKVAEDTAQLKDDTAEKIEDAVSEEVAEDEALGAEEDAIKEETSEPEVAKEDGGSSWFGWLWPFGGDDDDSDAIAEEGTDEPVATEEEASADAELDISPDLEETDVEMVEEETPAEETVTEEVVEEAGDEPVVDVAATEGSSEGKVNIANKLIYYFPNLFLNLIDSFSGKIGVGAKSGLELVLTRYAQFGGNYGDEYFVEKGIYRTYGGGYNNGFSLDFAPYSSEKRYIDDVFGSISPRIIKKKKMSLTRPTDPFYKEKYRDFWAVGFEGGWLINIGLFLNPIEFADFFTGIFFYDLCDDDLGRTEKGDAAVEKAEGTAGEVMEEGEAVEEEVPDADSDASEMEDASAGDTEEAVEAEVTDSDGDVEESVEAEEVDADGDVEEAVETEEVDADGVAEESSDEDTENSDLDDSEDDDFDDFE